MTTFMLVTIHLITILSKQLSLVITGQSLMNLSVIYVMHFVLLALTIQLVIVQLVLMVTTSTGQLVRNAMRLVLLVMELAETNAPDATGLVTSDIPITTEISKTQITPVYKSVMRQEETFPNMRITGPILRIQFVCLVCLNVQVALDQLSMTVGLALTTGIWMITHASIVIIIVHSVLGDLIMIANSVTRPAVSMGHSGLIKITITIGEMRPPTVPNLFQFVGH